jgi:4-diphosphocytidyl-2-C-methyl-D-erythritol kinase
VVASPGVGVTCRAPAKLNLYLHVLGQRSDGFHVLDSLVMFADVGDVVRVESGPTLTLAVAGPFADDLAATDPENNLVVRAARALARHGGLEAAATITLDKNLPVAAGIGGGSADAAATLHALNALWGLAASDAELAELGMEIGADVPACLVSQPLLMGGAGEQIELAPTTPALSLVLVGPNAPLSTAQVFGARQGTRSEHGRMTPSDSVQAFVQDLSGRHNDLQAAAVALRPVIGDALGSLEVEPGCMLARLSGSGSVCFGIFPSAEDAEIAAENIARHHPDWWVVATSTSSATAEGHGQQ